MIINSFNSEINAIYDKFLWIKPFSVIITVIFQKIMQDLLTKKIICFKNEIIRNLFFTQAKKQGLFVDNLAEQMINQKIFIPLGECNYRALGIEVGLKTEIFSIFIKSNKAQDMSLLKKRGWENIDLDDFIIDSFLHYLEKIYEIKFDSNELYNIRASLRNGIFSIQNLSEFNRKFLKFCKSTLILGTFNKYKQFQGNLEDQIVLFISELNIQDYTKKINSENGFLIFEADNDIEKIFMILRDYILENLDIIDEIAFFFLYKASTNIFDKNEGFLTLYFLFLPYINEISPSFFGKMVNENDFDDLHLVSSYPIDGRIMNKFIISEHYPNCVSLFKIKKFEKFDLTDYDFSNLIMISDESLDLFKNNCELNEGRDFFSKLKFFLMKLVFLKEYDHQIEDKLNVENVIDLPLNQLRSIQNLAINAHQTKILQKKQNTLILRFVKKIILYSSILLKIKEKLSSVTKIQSYDNFIDFFQDIGGYFINSPDNSIENEFITIFKKVYDWFLSEMSSFASNWKRNSLNFIRDIFVIVTPERTNKLYFFLDNAFLDYINRIRVFLNDIQIKSPIKKLAESINEYTVFSLEFKDINENDAIYKFTFKILGYSNSDEEKIESLEFKQYSVMDSCLFKMSNDIKTNSDILEYILSEMTLGMQDVFVIISDGLNWEISKELSLENSEIHCIESIFPSITISNLMSIIFGITPSIHGIVADNSELITNLQDFLSEIFVNINVKLYSQISTENEKNKLITYNNLVEKVFFEEYPAISKIITHMSDKKNLFYIYLDYFDKKLAHERISSDENSNLNIRKSLAFNIYRKNYSLFEGMQQNHLINDGIKSLRDFVNNLVSAYAKTNRNGLFIICSDHGLIYNTKTQNPGSVQTQHSRYSLNPLDEKRNIKCGNIILGLASDSNSLISVNEITHGGSTPLEVLVPLIILKNKKEIQD